MGAYCQDLGDGNIRCSNSPFGNSTWDGSVPPVDGSGFEVRLAAARDLRDPTVLSDANHAVARDAALANLIPGLAAQPRPTFPASAGPSYEASFEGSAMNRSIRGVLPGESHLDAVFRQAREEIAGPTGYMGTGTQPRTALGAVADAISRAHRVDEIAFSKEPTVGVSARSGAGIRPITQDPADGTIPAPPPGEDPWGWAEKHGIMPDPGYGIPGLPMPEKSPMNRAGFGNPGLEEPPAEVLEGKCGCGDLIVCVPDADGMVPTDLRPTAEVTLPRSRELLAILTPSLIRPPMPPKSLNWEISIEVDPGGPADPASLEKHFEAAKNYPGCGPGAVGIFPTKSSAPGVPVIRHGLVECNGCVVLKISPLATSGAFWVVGKLDGEICGRVRVSYKEPQTCTAQCRVKWVVYAPGLGYHQEDEFPITHGVGEEYVIDKTGKMFRPTRFSWLTATLLLLEQGKPSRYSISSQKGYFGFATFKGDNHPGGNLLDGKRFLRGRIPCPGLVRVAIGPTRKLASVAHRFYRSLPKRSALVFDVADTIIVRLDGRECLRKKINIRVAQGGVDKEKDADPADRRDSDLDVVRDTLEASLPITPADPECLAYAFEAQRAGVGAGIEDIVVDGVPQPKVNSFFDSPRITVDMKAQDYAEIQERARKYSVFTKSELEHCFLGFAVVHDRMTISTKTTSYIDSSGHQCTCLLANKVQGALEVELHYTSNEVRQRLMEKMQDEFEEYADPDVRVGKLEEALGTLPYCCVSSPECDGFLSELSERVSGKRILTRGFADREELSSITIGKLPEFKPAFDCCQPTRLIPLDLAFNAAWWSVMLSFQVSGKMVLKGNDDCGNEYTVEADLTGLEHGSHAGGLSTISGASVAVGQQAVSISSSKAVKGEPFACHPAYWIPPVHDGEEIIIAWIGIGVGASVGSILEAMLSLAQTLGIPAPDAVVGSTPYDWGGGAALEIVVIKGVWYYGFGPAVGMFGVALFGGGIKAKLKNVRCTINLLRCTGLK